MTPADPPSPAPEPSPAPAPPELPPESPPAPVETPTTMGSDAKMPDGAGAKPSEPGPVEPPGIVTSILPQRLEDARRAGNMSPSNDR